MNSRLFLGISKFLVFKNESVSSLGNPLSVSTLSLYSQLYRAEWLYFFFISVLIHPFLPAFYQCFTSVSPFFSGKNIEKDKGRKKKGRERERWEGEENLPTYFPLK